jgi:hypothetical protein
VGIHRQLVDVFRILGVVGAKLVRVAGGRGEVRDGLPVIAAAESGAAFAGATGDRQGDARIVSAGPHHGLAQAGNAQDGDPRGIHGAIGFQVIDGAAQAPRPGGD